MDMGAGGDRSPEVSPLHRQATPLSPLRDQARADSRRTVDSATVRPIKYRRWSPGAVCVPERDRSDEKHGHGGHGGIGYFLLMAIGSTGVVFGDIGTSPLYVFSGIFVSTLNKQPEPEDVPGVFSMIFWSLTWVVCLKYVAVVMRFNHQGEGGTFALMQTIVSARKSTTKPVLALAAAQPEEGSSEEETSEGQGTDVEELDIKDQDRSPLVTFLGMLGCSLLIGDGAITPVISVLSALAGLSDYIDQTWQVVLAVVLLLLLFAVQRTGTRIIGIFAGPIVVLWFLAIAATGFHAVVRHPKEASDVLAGINPVVAWNFCVNGRFAGKEAWRSLAGVVLAVTGAEALYADMGHFGGGPITAAWFVLVYPALFVQYWGQATVISADTTTYARSFWSTVPKQLELPMTVLATLSAILASQALISGMFSLISQAYALQLLPRLLVLHPNPQERGQVYIPEVNWLLCVTCILLCVAFKNSDALAGAYGIAVTGTFLVTTTLLFIALRRVHGWWLLPTLLVTVPMFLVDVAFYSANMIKIVDSGWVPVAITAVTCFLMHSHGWGRRRERVMALREAECRDLTPSAQGSRSITTIPELKAILRAGRVPRIGSAAVFLTPYEWRVPRSLDKLVQSVQCLPRTIVLLSLHFETVPFINEASRVQFEVVDQELELYRVSMHFGYAEPLTAERFAIPNRLAQIATREVAEHPGLRAFLLHESQGSDSDGEESGSESSSRRPDQVLDLESGSSGVTYIINRVHHAISKDHTCWTKARAAIYSLMVLNSRRPIRSFGLEAHNTMEIAVVRFL